MLTNNLKAAGKAIFLFVSVLTYKLNGFIFSSGHPILKC